MGISCEVSAFAYGDNQTVSHNTRVPELTLKKKNQRIACNIVREVVARDEWRTAYVNPNENEADLLTKPLLSG